jgi:preprotein translocase subunit SecA
MADRSWERGLHQMIEIREGLSVSGRNEHIARLTYQRFFRRYQWLSGMTGTAREVRRELWSIYRLPVVPIAPHRPCQRRLVGARVHADGAGRWAEVVRRVQDLQAVGRPVLVGTRSVADSEHFGALLQAAAIPHQVLNARQDADEAAIIARAGTWGAVTVATNMAGRGTDIRLGAGVAELGGLHVIATERNDAGRIDRQLFGRAARQGDPGSCEVQLSLEDDLLRAPGSAATRPCAAACCASKPGSAACSPSAAGWNSPTPSFLCFFHGVPGGHAGPPPPPGSPRPRTAPAPGKELVSFLA